jgi:hypothetical protein
MNTRQLLPMLAALLVGQQKLPEIRRIRRGETAGASRRETAPHIQQRRIDKALMKRARKAAVRLELL